MRQAINKIRTLTRQDFIKHNAIFFVGSLTIAAFNYVYYPVVGRLVSVTEFGEIQAVISLFMQLGIILTAFGYVVTNIINNTRNSSESIRVIVRLEQITLVLSTALFIILCATSVALKTSLQFSSIIPLILVGTLVIVNVPSTSRTYFLQGMKHLKEVSISGVLFAVGKLAITIVFIALTDNVLGVMLGYIIGQLLTLAYLMRKSRTVFPSIRSLWIFERNSSNDTLSTPLSRLVRREVIYGLVVLLLLSGLMVLYTSDSIIARLFFNPTETGLYGGVSAIARIVFFVTASVAGVLIATVRMGDHEKDNRRVLLKSIGIVTVIGGTATLIFGLLPELSINLLLGHDYLPYAHLLPFLCFVMMFCSYNNLLVTYQIALRRFWAIGAVATGILILILMITLFHARLEDLIIAYLVSNAVTCVILLVQIFRTRLL